MLWSNRRAREMKVGTREGLNCWPLELGMGMHMLWDICVYEGWACICYGTYVCVKGGHAYAMEHA